MFTTIIVGFDGSEGSRDALALALRLAEADASIALVDAYPAGVEPDSAEIGGYVEVRRLRVAQMLAEAAADDPRCEPCPIDSASPGQALHARRCAVTPS